MANILVITRSDPGGSVPRFLIDRGTPGGIVNDASKFLDWACGKDMEDFDDDDHDETLRGDDEEMPPRPHRHNTDLHNFQTNGHLAGLEEESPAPVKPDLSANSKEEIPQYVPPTVSQESSNGGLYSMVAGGFGAAGGFIANHTPQMISDRFSYQAPARSNENGSTLSSTRRGSGSSISTVSSTNSFTSALENRTTTQSIVPSNTSTTSTEKAAAGDSNAERELQKLESKKQKLDEKLETARAREISKQSEDSAKEEEALRKAEERHSRDVKKQEEKYQKELTKLQLKKEKEEKKAEERRRKAVEKDERAKLMREVEELKAEVLILKKDREILKTQVGDLQAENTMLAVRVGRMGGMGEEVLREVREEVKKGGRMRASSVKGLQRPLGLGRKNTASRDLSVEGDGKGKENSTLNGLPNPGFVKN